MNTNKAVKHIKDATFEQRQAPRLRAALDAMGESNAPRVYRGWKIFRNPRAVNNFTIYLDGWNQYHGFKSIENAKEKIDAIVG